jgi:putative transcriptional regulator
MMLTAGTILSSTSLMDDKNFEKTILLITEYNESGAIGFIVNKIFPRKLNELVAFKNVTPFILYNGGPVKNDQLYFIHNRPDIIEGGIFICNNIFLGGNFEQAVQHINHCHTASHNIKLFIGYCGWDAEQLEAEIEEGSWVIMDMCNKENPIAYLDTIFYNDGTE